MSSVDTEQSNSSSHFYMDTVSDGTMFDETTEDLFYNVSDEEEEIEGRSRTISKKDASKRFCEVTTNTCMSVNAPKNISAAVCGNNDEAGKAGQGRTQIQQQFNFSSTGFNQQVCGSRHGRESAETNENDRSSSEFASTRRQHSQRFKVEFCHSFCCAR